MMNHSRSGLLVAAMLSLATAGVARGETKLVDLTYIVDHPAIDAARKGIVDALGEAGFQDGKTIKLEVQSAQGSAVTQTQIAKKFVGDTPNLIIAISTPSAQAAQSATATIPIVFSAVTDPVDAKLVASLEHPGRNITGTSDQQPYGATFDLMQKLTPKAKHVGVIYNAGEANSVAQVAAFKTEAAKRGLAIVEASAAQSAMVPDAARSLVGRVDAILIPTDSTVVSAIESVVKVGIDAKLPVYASDTDSVTRGAMAALGFNYYELGKLSGRIAARVLRGENPGAIPVGFLDRQDLYLNLASARKMGVEIPEAVVAGASKAIP
jgi:putative tryptophan/tyrosine transport system substrate-binding protein